MTMDPRFPSEVTVARPSDIETLGRTITATAARDADSLRVLMARLPDQIDRVLTRRGIDPAARMNVVTQASKALEAITGEYEGLALHGEALTRVADTIVYLLKAKQGGAVEVGGFSITGA